MGTNGDLYIVAVAGTTNIDGNNFWSVGSGLVFSSPPGIWLKIGGLQNLQITTTVGNVVEPSNEIAWVNNAGKFFKLSPGANSGDSIRFSPGPSTSFSNNLLAGSGGFTTDFIWEFFDVVDHLQTSALGFSFLPTFDIPAFTGNPWDLGSFSIFVTKRFKQGFGLPAGRIRAYFTIKLIPDPALLGCFSQGFPVPCLKPPDNGFSFFIYTDCSGICPPLGDIPEITLINNYTVNGYATVMRPYLQQTNPSFSDVKNIYLQCTVTPEQTGQNSFRAEFMCLGDLPFEGFIYNNVLPMYINGYIDYLAEPSPPF
jgi:hypothetical protein